MFLEGKHRDTSTFATLRSRSARPSILEGLIVSERSGALDTPITRCYCLPVVAPFFQLPAYWAKEGVSCDARNRTPVMKICASS